MVTPEDISTFAKKHGIKQSFEVSAKTGQNIDDLFLTIGKFIHIQQGKEESDRSPSQLSSFASNRAPSEQDHLESYREGIVMMAEPVDGFRLVQDSHDHTQLAKKDKCFTCC